MNHNPLNSDQNEDQELDKLAPTLAGIRKGMTEDMASSPFAVPDDYFSSLNSEVMKKIEAIPDFETIPQENPFSVPPGYFESLPTVIQQRIIDRNAEGFTISGLIAGIIARPAPRFAMAFASVILFVFLSTLYFTRTIKVEYASQQPAESEQLVAAYLMQLDEDDLADLYVQEDHSSNEIQDEGIENYLLDNDIDLNSITDQL